MNKEQKNAVNEMAQKLREIRDIFVRNFPDAKKYLSLCIYDDTLFFFNDKEDKYYQIDFFEKEERKIEYSVEDE